MCFKPLTVGTSFPFCMRCSSLQLSSVLFFLISSLSSWPVDTCTKPSSAASIVHCVSLPLPGPPITLHSTLMSHHSTYDPRVTSLYTRSYCHITLHTTPCHLTLQYTRPRVISPYTRPFCYTLYIVHAPITHYAPLLSHCTSLRFPVHIRHAFSNSLLSICHARRNTLSNRTRYTHN